MSEITKVLSLDDNKAIDDDFKEQQKERRLRENEETRRRGEQAIKDVRETLIRNLPNLPKRHREIIEKLLLLNQNKDEKET